MGDGLPHTDSRSSRFTAPGFASAAGVAGVADVAGAPELGSSDPRVAPHAPRASTARSAGLTAASCSSLVAGAPEAAQPRLAYPRAQPGASLAARFAASGFTTSPDVALAARFA